MRILSIGCGAITQTHYVPALHSLGVEIVALLDPSDRSVAEVQKLCPSALRVATIAEARACGADAAIVASPSAYHASQAIEAMEAGLHVLCEKPMAGTVAEAEAMLEASRRTEKLLAIGLFRRFFPSSRAIGDFIRSEALGRLRNYTIAEGGLFNWQAASPTFFQKEHAHGGVLHDVGVHVLDLVIDWLGEPEDFCYGDDAAGGLETNCLLQLHHRRGLSGSVRLSRDYTTANRYFFEFERGWIGWRGGQADRIEIGLYDCETVGTIALANPTRHWGQPAPGSAAITYAQSFTAQIQNFLRAINGSESLVVPGEEGIRSLRLIEACYSARKEMATR